MLAYIPSWINKPFIWAILAVISLAYISPEIGNKGGLLKPEITIKYGAVAAIFLISGLSLKLEELGSAVLQYHFHFFVQCFSLLFTPILTQMILSVGILHLTQDLFTGFVIVSCMPPPVSSAIILTKEVGGNELGSSSSLSVLEAFFHLSFTIIFPVMVGQFLHYFYERVVLRHSRLLSRTSSTLLLLIIYSTFCETFSQGAAHFDFVAVINTIIISVLLQSLLMTIVFYFTTWFDIYFSPEDTIAAMFCATHKSLTLGFPLLKLLYEGRSKFMIISFPLLVYHPTQILLGSLLVPFLQTWLQKWKRKKRKHTFYPV